MGDVIKIERFRKRELGIGKEPKAEENAKDVPNRPEYESDTEFLLKITSLVLELFPKLMTATNGANERQLVRYENVVREYTYQELLGFLQQSSELQWSAKPAFYKAIMQEAMRRVELIRAKISQE